MSGVDHRNSTPHFSYQGLKTNIHHQDQALEVRAHTLELRGWYPLTAWAACEDTLSVEPAVES